VLLWSFNVRRPSSVRASVRQQFPVNNISSETAYWILTKLQRNDPWVVLYQICSNRSSWLHKKVTGSKNRFSKCNFQKSSCPKLQGPELSYLVYNIILRSSTKVVQIMPLGSKLTPLRGSQFYIDVYKENFKWHLLFNHLWEFDQTSQEWSLGGPLSKMFKPF